jgi:hypothetical protein
MVFLHPDDPETWQCKICQSFTAQRNGRFALSALARARNAVHQFAREHLRHAAAQDVPPPPQPQQTGSAAPGDQEETV